MTSGEEFPYGRYGSEGLGNTNFDNGKNDLQPNRQLSDKQEPMTTEVVHALQDAEGVTWNEFTQNTTFHGIRYIFDRSPSASKWRR